METCQRCESNRIAFLGGQSNDYGYAHFQGKTQEGYLPFVKNLCDCDGCDFSVCLDCGQVQGNFPVDINLHAADED